MGIEAACKVLEPAHSTEAPVGHHNSKCEPYHVIEGLLAQPVVGERPELTGILGPTVELQQFCACQCLRNRTAFSEVVQKQIRHVQSAGLLMLLSARSHARSLQ